MRRQTREDVAEAARRRLGVLDREVDDAPVDADVVAPAGRHARTHGPGWTAWLEDRLPPTLRGTVRLGNRELAVVAVVLALGLALAAAVVLRGQDHPVSAPLDPPSRTRSTAPVQTPAGATTGSTKGNRREQAAPGKVVVDVAGKVRHPGVFRLPEGSRVIDAIRRAGGPRPHVDLTPLNLAQVLADGQQVVVGASVGVGAAASAAAGSTPASGPLVNLNSATLTQLETLPGVGPVTAGKILAWRGAHGSFSSVDELLEIDGIGEKTLADLAPYVTL